MTDFVVHLPPNFRYLNQFAPSSWAPNPSKYRCGTAVSAMVAEIAYPGKWIPEELEHDLYVKWAGPDVPTDENGVTKEQILAWLSQANIGHIDMSNLVAEFQNGNRDPLHNELMAQNRQHVPQILTVNDESQLYDIAGHKLHAWADQGLHHVILRVGFSDDQGYGLYYEPAAPGFPQPVKIPWERIIACGLITAIAIMPAGVPQPPVDFRFTQGVWPPPKPVISIDDAMARIESVEQAMQASLAALSLAKRDLGH